ncbi:MAG: OsmC family protein [Bdellovibrionales bacterium]|nr:OsmC family protein [Bdellovibrionales bacterium]
MRVTTHWKEKMVFEATADGRSVPMDAKSPIGTDTALTPKQLVVAGLAGCTAMDVIALMKKHKQPVESFEIDAEVEKSGKGYPEVFTSASLTFRLKGDLDPARVIEAVVSSQTKYCGVSAMLAKAFPIRYRIELNGSLIGEEGRAFPEA